MGDPSRPYSWFRSRAVAGARADQSVTVTRPAHRSAPASWAAIWAVSHGPGTTESASVVANHKWRAFMRFHVPRRAAHPRLRAAPTFASSHEIRTDAKDLAHW